MPITSLATRLAPIAGIARKRGLRFEWVGSMAIVLDGAGGFLAVALCTDSDFIVSTVFDRMVVE